jgi:hypothetical protein
LISFWLKEKSRGVNVFIDIFSANCYLEKNRNKCHKPNVDLIRTKSIIVSARQSPPNMGKTFRGYGVKRPINGPEAVGRPPSPEPTAEERLRRLKEQQERKRKEEEQKSQKNQVNDTNEKKKKKNNQVECLAVESAATGSASKVEPEVDDAENTINGMTESGSDIDIASEIDTGEENASNAGKKVKPQAELAVKVATKALVKTAVKTAVKTTVKAGAKAVVKAAVKTTVKTGEKEAAKSVSQAAAKLKTKLSSANAAGIENREKQAMSANAKQKQQPANAKKKKVVDAAVTKQKREEQVGRGWIEMTLRRTYFSLEKGG